MGLNSLLYLVRAFRRGFNYIKKAKESEQGDVAAFEVQYCVSSSYKLYTQRKCENEQREI